MMWMYRHPPTQNGDIVLLCHERKRNKARCVCVSLYVLTNSGTNEIQLAKQA